MARCVPKRAQAYSEVYCIPLTCICTRATDSDRIKWRGDAPNEASVTGRKSVCVVFACILYRRNGQRTEYMA